MSEVSNSTTAYFEDVKQKQNEPGTLSPCPFCGTPRNQRSCYIRCRTCGINWSAGEDLSKDPRLSREKPKMKAKEDI